MRRDRRGSAIIIVMIVVTALFLLAMLVVQSARTLSQVSVEERYRLAALEAAEAGVGLTAQLIAETQGQCLATSHPRTVTAAPRTYPVGAAGGITVTVTVTDLGADGRDDDGDGTADDPEEAGVVRVVSQASVAGGRVRRRVECFLKSSLHPAFHKAMFVGNDSGTSPYTVTLGPGNAADRTTSSDNPPHVPQPAWDLANHNQTSDYVEGDVYVDGNVRISGGTDVFGTIDTTGVSDGQTVQGPMNEGQARIPSPDLQAQSYAAIADRIIDGTTTVFPAWMRGQQPDAYYGTGPAGLGTPANHTLKHFHLGTQAGTLPFSAADDGTLVLVRGNLWIHTDASLNANFPANPDVAMTVVVEGNVFIADDVNYNGAGDGLVIIAMSAGESYTDTNLNYKRDPGEPILNDDGDGVYEGPVEGQGNVFFGDPRFGTGGVTDGYLYAQNNVYLVNTATSGSQTGNSQDRVWGVNGMLSAGNLVLLGGRTSGPNYNDLRIKYDERFKSLNFKGIPKGLGGGWAGVAAQCWRELAPDSP